MFTNAKLETSCKNEREPAKIAIYSVYYTKSVNSMSFIWNDNMREKREANANAT
jgi:hypothetical protein